MNYVHQANEELNAAQEREREGDYSAAVKRYRMAVDIFMKGVQGKTRKMFVMVFYQTAFFSAGYRI